MTRIKFSTPMIYLGLLILLFALPAFFQQPYVLHVLITIIINIILASSLRLIATSGQLSLAHGGMVSIGAYASALLVMQLGLNFWVALPAAGLFIIIFSSLVGKVFIRLKGIYFTMATLFLSQIIEKLIEEWRGVTGGVTGLLNIPRPNAISIPGLFSITFTSRVEYYYLALVLFTISMVILYAIEKSRIGTTFLAIKQSESLAKSIGISGPSFRIIAFVAGSFFAGISGAFYGHYFTAVTPSSFSFLFGIYILIYMVVGGMKYFAGPIIGAIVLTIIPELARVIKQYEPLVFAVILFVIILYLPEGLISIPRRINILIKKRLSYVGSKKNK